MNTEELSFEEAFRRLQTAIQTLEEGGLSLEDSIQQFETGMKLANLCASRLDEAELKVSRLLAGRDAPEEGVPLVSYTPAEVND
jgi:exodeoxyribonuclease VII small subunit